MSEMSNESVVIDVEVALAKADRDFETFKKKIEQPITMNVSGPGSGTTTQGKTFAGQNVTTGAANFVTPSAVQGRGPTIQSQMEQGIIMRSSTASMGGTGFFHAGGPVPTAATNSVYGGISQGVPIVPMSAGMTQRQTQLETMLGSVSTQMSAAKGTERQVLARQAGHIMDELGYSPLDASAPRASTPRTPRAASVGWLRQSDIVQDTSFFSTRRGIGFDRATAGAAVVAAGGLAADQFIGANQAARDKNRFDSTADAAEADYQQARGTRGITRAIGGFLNSVFNNDYFTSDETVQASRDTARAARAMADAPGIQRGIDAYRADTGTIGLSGTALARAKADVQFTAELKALNAALIDPATTNPDLVQKQIAATEERQRRTVAELDRLDNSQAKSLRLGTALQSNSRDAAFRGNDLQASLLGIAAKFDPEINALADQIARVPNGDAMWESLTEQRNSLLEQRAGAQQNARTSFAQSVIGQVGGLRSAAAALNYRPFDAQRTEVEAAFDARITRVDENGNRTSIDPSSPEGVLASAARRTALAQIDQDQRFQSRAINTSIDAQDQATTYGFLRNQVGADAAIFAGGVINQMRDLAKGQFQGEAEKLRTSAIRQLDLSAFNYQSDFRADEFDAQNLLVNPRDVENYAAALNSINAEQDKIRNADPNIDRVNMSDGGNAGLDSLADKLIKGLGEEFRTALRDVASGD